jgi:hypothetical protein
MIMKTTSTLAAALFAISLSSCMFGPDEEGRVGTGDNTVTFVVSTPAASGESGSATRAMAGGGGNGHFPGGVPANYRNYSDDADTATYGTAFGGYPDAEAEQAAFKRAVAAMSANYAETPAKNNPHPTTRAIPEGSGQETEDNRVDDITILLFDSTNKLLVKTINVGRPADGVTIEEYPGDKQRKQFTLSLPDGSYKAVFVANCREAVASLPLTTPLSYLTTPSNGVRVPQTGMWTTNRPFPMASLVVDFKIPNTTTDFSKKPVELIRSLAKINVKTTLPTDRFTIKNIVVHKYNNEGLLMPHPDWRKGMNTLSLANANAPQNVLNATGRLVYADKITNNQCVDEIFVYEQAAENLNTTEECMNSLSVLVCADVEITGQHGGTTTLTDRWYRINILKTDPADNKTKLVDIIRNYRYDLIVEQVNSRGYETEQEALANLPTGLELVITEKSEMPGGTAYNGEYQLTTDRSVIILGHEAGASASMNVYTDYDGGWQTSTPTENFVTLSGATSQANDQTPSPLTVTMSANTGNTIRRTSFTIVAGTLSKEIVIVQLPDPDNVTAKSNPITDYVGAFWKYNQRGERLIALNPDKEWSAFVLDGADWVVMDTKPSTDATVLTTSGPALSGNDPDFERLHSVTSTVGWASGATGSRGGYFRLGIRNSHAATSDVPARYAVVLMVDGDVTDLSKNPGNQFISRRLLYLRQGEGPDYLFRPNDPVPSGILAGPNRPAARKFSPYNLTAQTLDASVNRYDEPNGPNPSRFAEYPSQAGAFFQWANATNMRYAWNPNSLTVAGWDEVAGISNWDLMGTNHEACPVGYHRPTDGPTDRISDMTSAYDMKLSEIRQSLFLSPIAGSIIPSESDNMMMGFYADGFFDRRVVTSMTSYDTSGTLSTEENSVVSATNNQIAYRGYLVYNRSSHASLFFPAAGFRMRNTSDGSLTRAGGTIRYWSSSLDQNPWALYTGSPAEIPTLNASYNINMGYSVRCVKDYASDAVILPEFDNLLGQFRLRQQSDIDIAIMIFDDAEDNVDNNRAKPGQSLIYMYDATQPNNGYIGYQNFYAHYGSTLIGTWGGDPTSGNYPIADGKGGYYYSGESFWIDVEALNNFPEEELSRYINIYICARWYHGGNPHADVSGYITNLWLEYWSDGEIYKDDDKFIFYNEGGTDVNPEKGQDLYDLALYGNSPGAPTLESWIVPDYIDPSYYNTPEAPPTRIMRVRYDRVSHKAVAFWYHKNPGDDYNWPTMDNVETPTAGGVGTPPEFVPNADQGRIYKSR